MQQFYAALGVKIVANDALLATADGEVLYGKSIGWQSQACGEVVFNTAMTGYQEILTDPSYREQMVVLTYPHIGNTGVNPDDVESDHIHAKGLIIRDYPKHHANWRSHKSLSDYLIEHRVVAIAEIDTRYLTKRLVMHGAQKACIQTGKLNPKAAILAAQQHPDLIGRDLTQDVTCQRAHNWTTSLIDLERTSYPKKTKPTDHSIQPHIVVVDYGVKQHILRLLVDKGARVTVVPARTSLEDIQFLKPDGILLSNGPGDPAACQYAIKLTQRLMQTNIPILGICLGFQILALAASAKTFKMTFGHHGANHPIQDIQTGQVLITSQNHGFAVDEKSLPKDFKVTHRSLFDGTVQGIRHQTKPIFAFQGHPEASPGPHDLGHVFADFIQLTRMSAKTECLTHA